MPLNSFEIINTPQLFVVFTLKSSLLRFLISPHITSTNALRQDHLRFPSYPLVAPLSYSLSSSRDSIIVELDLLKGIFGVLHPHKDITHSRLDLGHLGLNNIYKVIRASFLALHSTLALHHIVLLLVRLLELDHHQSPPRG